MLANFLPLLAAIAAIPFLLAALGTERFGLLSLVWILVGYFSFFDLGLGRSLTKMVAELRGSGREADLPSLCSTGVAIVAVVGMAGGLLAAAALPWVDLWVDRPSGTLREEARFSLLLVAVGVPLVVSTTALRGILEGFMHFRLLSAIRAPAGVLLFVAPCIGAFLSPRLDVAVCALLIGRILVLFAHLLPCQRVVRLSIKAIDHHRWARPMLHFGGWLTVSNIVGPVIVNLDRFLIGATLSSAAVAYYSVPFETVSRLLLIPISLVSALFPELVQTQASSVEKARALRNQSTLLLLGVVLPICGLGAYLAEPVLRAWLGAEFAAQGAVVMQILLVGFALNAAAQIPFAALQGFGHTRQTALLHLIELPLYVALLMLLLTSYGLAGAAIAWCLRALIDLIALMWLLRRVEQRRQSADISQTFSAGSHAGLHGQG